MSSSFGGSGGTGGSGGIIRYAIVIDDSQVNQKLANFQSTLGRINTATQSSASGFQGLNSTLQTMDSSITSTAKDIDAINNNFRGMDSSVQSTTKNMGALSNNFKGVEGGLTRSNTLLGQGSEATKTFGQRMKSAGSFVKDNALAIGVASSSIINLVSSYTSLQKAQNTLEKAQNVEIGMRNNIIDLTNKHAEAVKNEGANSQKAISIGRDLELLRNKDATQLEKISLMEQQLNEQRSQAFTQAISDSILFGSSIAQIAGTVSSNSDRIKKSIGGIGNAARTAGPLLAGIGLALGKIGLAVGSFVVLDQITKHLEQMNPKLKESADKNREFEDSIGKLLDNIPGMKDLQTVTRGWAGEIEKMVKDIFPGFIADQKLINEANKNAVKSMDTATVSANEFAVAASKIVDPTKQTTAALLDLRTGLEALPAGVSAGSLALNEMSKNFDFLKEGGTQAVTEIEDALQTATTSGKNWDKQIEESNKALDALKPSSLIMAEIDSVLQDLSFSEKDWNQSIAQSNDLLKKLGELKEGAALKSIFKIEGKPDKVLGDLIKNLPNVFEKEIKLALKIDQKSDDLKESISNFLGYSLQNFSIDDSKADQLGKSIITEIDDKFKGKKMPQEWKNLKSSLEAAIANPNTKDALWKLLQQIETNQPINIPVTPKFEISSRKSKNQSNSAEIEELGLDDIFVLKPIELPAPNTKVFDSAIQGAKDAVTGSKGSLVSTINSATTTIPGPNITGATKNITRLIGNFNGWVSTVNKANPVVKINAKNAFATINRIVGNLNGIPNITRTVHIHEERHAHMAKGGLISKAKGGLMSAADGTFFTTSGPQMVMAGDNPGGRETVAFIPHDNPNPTLAKIERLFGSGTKEGGNIVINNVTKIDGSGIINDREFSKRVKLELGKHKDRFM